MSNETLKDAPGKTPGPDLGLREIEADRPANGPDLLLLAEALAQLNDRDRVPSEKVIRHIVEKHGISWEEAVVELKSFAVGH